MTLTKESEALLAEVYGTTMALTVFPARLAAIEAAVRAEQAAEVERLRARLRTVREDGAIGHPELDLSYFPVWHLEGTRCDLCDILDAATPVAPAPAAAEMCATCHTPRGPELHHGPAWFYCHPFQPAPAATGEGQTPVAPAPNSAPNPPAPGDEPDPTTLLEPAP